MPSQTTVDLARVIQLAVAPVFLLLGISGLLGVLAGRSGRVIDRARRLEALPPPFPPDTAEQRHQRARAELAVLSRRAVLVNRAIALCVLSALLVGAVIVALFLGVFFAEDFPLLVSAIFIAALLCLCGALVEFLREIRLAMQHLTIGR
jgi:hypothetical protein